ncbi:MAG TPA: LysE family transporter [Stellaceae bacterium]|nr:LysE family transporter [Stellaceae bacterium]
MDRASLRRQSSPWSPLPLPISLLLKGIAIGIVIAVPAGPVGVLCVRRTLFEGALFGIVSAFGAALADMVFGLIAGFGLTVVRDWLLGFQDALAILGGFYLLYVGLHALLRGPALEAQPLTGEKLAYAFASTFALSITNPVTILAFAAIFAKVGFSNGGLDWLGVCVLVGGVLAGSLLWWLGLILGITAVKRSAHTVHFSWINRISGTILTVSGLGLLASVVITWIWHSA